MSDAMSAEFGTVAGWTAEAALALGPEFRVPAGCRGSGSPPTLDWLLARLQPDSRTAMLDCGAGVGGPAAYAAQRTGVTPVLTDPEHDACRAAVRLFGLPAVQAAGTLPFGDRTFDLAWSLGVLCTVPGPEQGNFVAELYRVLRPDARLGLLAFVRTGAILTEQPAGNTFPTESRLRTLVSDAGFTVDEVRDDDLGAVPAAWSERVDAVERQLVKAHGHEPAWRVAVEQAAIMGRLLERGEVAGRLVLAHR